MCCLIILIHHPPENQQLAPRKSMVGKCFFKFPVGISYISDIFRYAINGWNTWHVLLKDIHPGQWGKLPRGFQGGYESHHITDHLLPALVDSHSVRGYVHRYGHLTHADRRWHVEYWQHMEEDRGNSCNTFVIWLYDVQKEYESWKSGRFAGRVQLLLSCSALFNCLCCIFCMCKWDNSLI